MRLLRLSLRPPAAFPPTRLLLEAVGGPAPGVAGGRVCPGLLAETAPRSPGSDTRGALPGLTLLLPPWLPGTR